MQLFKTKILQKKEEDCKDKRFADVCSLVKQETNEKYYNEKFIMKSNAWLEQVEDEFRRD
jgi:hypothetical protein